MTPIAGATVADRKGRNYWKYVLGALALSAVGFWCFAFFTNMGPSARPVIAYLLFALFAVGSVGEVLREISRYQLTEHGIELYALGWRRERIRWDHVCALRTHNFDRATNDHDVDELLDKPLNYDSRRGVILTLRNGREITLETESHLNEFFTLRFISMHCPADCVRNGEFAVFPNA
ncbi:MAG: hypothetical protein AMXMBFR84_13500 [Candidatus Hydrogenedentota bacterium]